MITLSHKNAPDEQIEPLTYGKWGYSMYGYLVVNNDEKVLFFYSQPGYEYDIDKVEYRDVTDEYNIIRE